ncbi:hypothetical protein FSP39_018619 [Pinctada imbricata]|uniref:ubiquitinyl hydrolase 1 n=1 Tax=Pinctada imbricata TaxID=66713 RepID=A0AA88Y585_PINIB|nr:hypothetical protein FSP39_018619 [Pinctada imbricata]
MRVLESGATPSYNMGKSKKHKLRKTKEASESSDEGSVPTCNHVNMAVNVAAMKKGLAKQTYGECASCANEAGKINDKSVTDGGTDSGTGAEETLALSDAEPTLWVCLQCGNQGCDRNSRDKHALKHYETPRSSCHCLVINTTSWSAWCYKCDDEVPIERSKRLQECIDLIRKQAGLPQGEGAQGAGKRSSGGAVAPAVTDQSSKTRPIVARTTSIGSCQKIKGLSNLGNTCFFNAVMQNLTQTPNLESLLIDRSKKGRALTLCDKHYSDSEDSMDEDSDIEIMTWKDLPSIDIVLPEAGMLTQSLINFLQEMNNYTTKSSTVNPGALFGQICKKNQRFRGFQQQDSHELLRYLMDNMRTEEIKRGQTGILKHFKLSENVNPKKVDETTRTKIKEYGRQVKHTFIDSLFGGHLISTVTCEECKYISQIFEPFLDLSLPVAEEKPQRPNQIVGARKKDSTSTEPTEEPKPTGVDGFAHKPDKPSKNSVKKQKQQKKKNSKRGNKEGEGEPEGEDDDDKTPNKESKEGEEIEEGQSSNKEDCSDADIEDNLESDMSRCSTFADLSVSMSASLTIPNLDTIAQNDEDGEEGETTHTSSTCTVTETSSSATLKLDRSNPDICKGQDEKSSNSGSMSNSVCSNGSGGSMDGNVSAEFTIVCNGGDAFELAISDEGMNGSQEKLSSSSANKRKSASVFENHGNEVCEVANRNSEDFLQINHVNDSKNGVLDEKDLVEKLENLAVNGKDLSDLQTESANLENENKAENLHTQKDSRLEQDNTIEAENELNSCNSKPDSAGSQRKSTPNISRQNSKHSKSKFELKKEARVKSKVTLGPRYVPSSRECSIMSCLHQFTSAELLTGNNKFGCSNCTDLKYKQTPAKEKRETVYSNAAKQYLIHAPPAVLTLHLKRFEQVGFSSRKVNRHVDFPFVLDLAPFCSSLCQGVKLGQKKVLYSLFGVVEHSGRLNAGHYTAYVKVRPQIGITTNFLNLTQPSTRDCLQRYYEMVNNELATDTEEGEETLEEKLVPPGRWYHISDSRVSEATESAVQRAQAYLLFYERIY